MVLNFSFLPLQAPERSIVCKLHLKYAPFLQLGSHLRRLEEPPPSPSPTPFPSKAGRRGRAATKKGAGNDPASPQYPWAPGAPILQLKGLTSSGVEGPNPLVDPNHSTLASREASGPPLSLLLSAYNKPPRTGNSLAYKVPVLLLKFLIIMRPSLEGASLTSWLQPSPPLSGSHVNVAFLWCVTGLLEFEGCHCSSLRSSFSWAEQPTFPPGPISTRF